MKKLVSFEEHSSSKLDLNEKVSLKTVQSRSKNKKEFVENIKKISSTLADNKEFLDQLEKSFSKTEGE
jgi:hypothetical protein